MQDNQYKTGFDEKDLVFIISVEIHKKTGPGSCSTMSMSPVRIACFLFSFQAVISAFWFSVNEPQ